MDFINIFESSQYTGCTDFPNSNIFSRLITIGLIESQSTGDWFIQFPNIPGCQSPNAEFHFLKTVSIALEHKLSISKDFLMYDFISAFLLVTFV